MHPDTNTMLIIIAAAVALMIVGFGLRDRNLGLGLLGIGLIAALATIATRHTLPSTLSTTEPAAGPARAAC